MKYREQLEHELKQTESQLKKLKKAVLVGCLIVRVLRSRR